MNGQEHTQGIAMKTREKRAAREAKRHPAGKDPAHMLCLNITQLDLMFPGANDCEMTIAAEDWADLVELAQEGVDLFAKRGKGGAA